jgi:tRNA threonylcarbamoyl adenosine modification protein YeaZ
MVFRAKEEPMSRQLTLSIETASSVCSVFLADQNGGVERRTDQRGAHAERLPGFIQELLEEYSASILDVEAIVLSAGPGSYTGLRIGASLVKGLCFGRNIPFYAANTLASMAIGAPLEGGKGTVHAVLDARRTHLYHQSFRMDESSIIPLMPPAARELEEIRSMMQPGDVVSGTGWQRLSDLDTLGVRLIGLEGISALHIHRLYVWSLDQQAASCKGLIERVAIDHFEPDYRGNPYT